MLTPREFASIFVLHMPIRTLPLVKNHYYLIFNRGVARQPIFFTNRDYKRFIFTLNYYRAENPLNRLSKFLDTPETEKLTAIQLHAKLPNIVTINAYIPLLLQFATS